jgi:TRAP transporter TAXI family solute receptor
MMTISSNPRRRLLGLAAGIALAVLMSAACGGEQPASPAESAAPAPTGGRLSIATGNTTGVYYQLGGGYADLITKHMPGWQATAEATGASVENIQRVVRGDSDIAFTLADAAGDAATGKGAFTSPQPIRALARIYTNYTQVVARAGTGISTVADMKGKKVSTGSPNSGTENIAFRLLKAAGLDADKDISKQSLSLPETVQGLKDGTIDAMFWSGGLPTAGITDLVTSLKEKAVFVPLNNLLPALQKEYGQVYQAGTLSASTYKTASDVPTIVVPNLIVVKDTMHPSVAHDLTKVLFDFQEDLGKVHPEGKNITRENGAKTEPVVLHPGAANYFAGK